VNAEQAPLMQSLPEQLVAEFFSEYSRSRSHDRDLIARLTRLALSEDPAVAEPATRAIFASLVEPLADSFEPDAAALYNRVFAQIIQSCREDSRAVALDRELTTFGLASEEDLIARAQTLTGVRRLTARRELTRNPKQVILLSRVTLGADVAITSVIIERIKADFPASEIVLLGGSKTKELFGGDPRLQFKELAYRRGGVLIERLLTWIDLLACVRELTHGLTNDEYLVVDPDSRLTQLGLLPVTNNTGTGTSPNYLFFPSREYRSTTSQSLAELTGAWLNEIFGESATTHPRVNLKPEDVDVAHRLASQLRGSSSRRIVALNFGVGDNPLKRVGDEFEISLIDHLAREGVAIILDKGAGVEEIALVDKVLAEATRIEPGRRRLHSIEVNENNLLDHLTATHLDTNILAWNGRIGMLAALIGESDLYIGYDSAGQHIAAALGVPCIDVFAGSSSLRMLDRWKPAGKAETRVVPADTLSGAKAEDIAAMVAGHARESLRNKGTQKT
jgi:ADP-heptose:LPS heptosyltransferase